VAAVLAAQRYATRSRTAYQPAALRQNRRPRRRRPGCALGRRRPAGATAPSRPASRAAFRSAER